MDFSWSAVKELVLPVFLLVMIYVGADTAGELDHVPHEDPDHTVST